MQRQHRFLFVFLHLMTIFCGGAIYVCFRSGGLLMFRWFNFLGIGERIAILRNDTVAWGKTLPNWFLFSLPDGLFLFSYVSLMLAIWNKEVARSGIFWVSSIPVLIILSELGQLFLVVPGTFDIVDLLFYVAGTCIPFFLFHQINDKCL